MPSRTTLSASGMTGTSGNPAIRGAAIAPIGAGGGGGSSGGGGGGMNSSGGGGSNGRFGSRRLPAPGNSAPPGPVMVPIDTPPGAGNTTATEEPWIALPVSVPVHVVEVPPMPVGVHWMNSLPVVVVNTANGVPAPAAGVDVPVTVQVMLPVTVHVPVVAPVIWQVCPMAEAHGTPS